MAAAFKRAVKKDSKLRMALAGPAGSGKTYTSLVLARELAAGMRVALIDTERGSASKYADLFEFDVCELDSFHPDHYVEAIRAAVEAGYGVVVVDSLSHAWNGADGLLSQVERVAKIRHGGNTFKAWGDAEIRRMESALVEALTGSPVHIIATMRSKTEYVVEQNERGKATPRKVGLAPVQRDGFEYEFDVFGELTQDNELMVHKTRCPALAGAVIPTPGKPLAATLKAWLRGGPPSGVMISPVPALVADPPAERERPVTWPNGSKTVTATRKPAKAAPEAVQPRAEFPVEPGEESPPSASDWAAMLRRALAAHIVASRGEYDDIVYKATGVRASLVQEIGTRAQWEKVKAALAARKAERAAAGATADDAPLAFVETDGEGRELPPEPEPVEIDQEMAAAVGRRGK